MPQSAAFERERNMNRENDVVELGTASIETKGPKGNIPDVALGQALTGLSDD